MAENVRPPVAIRIVRPYPTEEEFLESELETVGKTSVILIGAHPRPTGVILRFEVTLATGHSVLRGEGRVLGHKESAFRGQPGLSLRFTRLDPKSKALVDRAAAIREARLAGESNPPPPPNASQSPQSFDSFGGRRDGGAVAQALMAETPSPPSASPSSPDLPASDPEPVISVGAISMPTPSVSATLPSGLDPTRIESAPSQSIDVVIPIDEPAAPSPASPVPPRAALSPDALAPHPSAYEDGSEFPEPRATRPLVDSDPMIPVTRVEPDRDSASNASNLANTAGVGVPSGAVPSGAVPSGAVPSAVVPSGGIPSATVTVSRTTRDFSVRPSVEATLVPPSLSNQPAPPAASGLPDEDEAPMNITRPGLGELDPRELPPRELEPQELSSSALEADASSGQIPVTPASSPELAPAREAVEAPAVAGAPLAPSATPPADAPMPPPGSGEAAAAPAGRDALLARLRDRAARLPRDQVEALLRGSR